jgi:DNA helicase-2/ATP-dependent DNA helicase PcrA
MKTVDNKIEKKKKRIRLSKKIRSKRLNYKNINKFKINKRKVKKKRKVDTSIFSGLNDNQIKCIETHDGPLLVLAGAGTGKTRVISLRYLNILQKGADLGQILVVTFTNKAADEMKQRIMNLLKRDNIKGLWIGTFHSLCARILRNHSEIFSLNSNFVIVNSDDREKIIKKIVEDHLIYAAEDIKDVSKRISKWKNEGLLPSEIKIKNNKDDIQKQIYTEYKKYMESRNSVDFDDLLLLCNKLFLNNPEILKTYQEKFKYIMVDEFQDTNFSQYQWLKYLAVEHNNICCLGDDDQSIYKFRGAEVKNIFNFKNEFKTQTIYLEQNYRSTNVILSAASAVIKENQTRFKKNLWTNENSGENIEVFILDKAENEAEIVANNIKKLWNKGEKLTEIAILIRTNSLAVGFENYLKKFQIPYELVGTSKFYQLPEIQDCLAYIRLLNNPKDDISLQKILRNPVINAPLNITQSILDIANEEKISLLVAFEKYLESKILFEKQLKLNNLNEFLLNFKSWQELKNSMSIYELAQLIFEQSGYLKFLENSNKNKIENINELVLIIEKFQTFEDFIQYASLNSEEIVIHRRENYDYVKIMTLHCSKGLEFNNVFLVAWEEGSFPNPFLTKKKEEFEEERRLAYVGITRARRKVFISYCKYRFQTNNKHQVRGQSRFLASIPDNLKHITDYSTKTTNTNTNNISNNITSKSKSFKKWK